MEIIFKVNEHIFEISHIVMFCQLFFHDNSYLQNINSITILYGTYKKATPFNLLFKTIELIFKIIELIFKIIGLIFKIRGLIFKIRGLIFEIRGLIFGIIKLIFKIIELIFKIYNGNYIKNN